ncbi:hypothetical protein PALB_7640 [Pseudoalteromonas luteoviolacea B = ATCC 29581]|nr:hypothetical protein PALB_7640 [Pseudoalteromonas luteoviolacea B = ATCC 29581]
MRNLLKETRFRSHSASFTDVDAVLLILIKGKPLAEMNALLELS